jgi:hypothetical protein
MGRDAYESLAMAVFVSAAMWLGASHGTGARTAREPSIAVVRDPEPKGSLQITFSLDPADAYSAGGYWDWIEQQHAMP